MDTDPQTGNEVLKPSGADRTLELYRTRDPRWAETISVRQYFRETPGLFDARTASPVPDEGWKRWIPNLAIALACALILAAGEWRFEQLFASRDVQRTVALTGVLGPLSRGVTPAICREHVSRINDALERRDWLGALDRAESLASVPALRSAMDAGPRARDWLRTLLVVAPVQAAENSSGAAQRALYDRALRNHAVHGPWADEGFEVQRALLLARFHQQGGTFPNVKLGQAERASAERLAADVGEFRNRFGSEIAADSKARAQLLMIEGFSIARRLSEATLKARFDAGSQDNHSRWRRLEVLLAEGRKDLGLANDRDLIRLELFFWEAAESFTWPNGFDDRVTIGGWSARESEIDGNVERLRQRLGVTP